MKVDMPLNKETKPKLNTVIACLVSIRKCQDYLCKEFLTLYHMSNWNQSSDNIQWNQFVVYGYLQAIFFLVKTAISRWMKRNSEFTIEWIVQESDLPKNSSKEKTVNVIYLEALSS